MAALSDSSGDDPPDAEKAARGLCQNASPTQQRAVEDADIEHKDNLEQVRMQICGEEQLWRYCTEKSCPGCGTRT